MESRKDIQEPDPAALRDSSEQQPPPFILQLCSIPWRSPAAFQSLESTLNTLAAGLCPSPGLFWRGRNLSFRHGTAKAVARRRQR